MKNSEVKNTNFLGSISTPELSTSPERRTLPCFGPQRREKEVSHSAKALPSTVEGSDLLSNAKTKTK